MVRINLERRAEIGKEKRARTRALLLAAARTCFAERNGSAPTVEAVTQTAGLAKGTFYLHFPDISTLEAELGDALIEELTERLEPARQSVADPLNRVATGVTIFLRDLAGAPTQARLAAHAIALLPNVGRAVQIRLRGDLSQARSKDQVAVGSDELAASIVVAIVEQAARLFGAGRFDASAIPDMMRAMLRALGCPPEDAARRADEAARNADAFALGLANRN